MTSYNHTPISTGAAANASTFNTPIGSIDAAIGDKTTLTTTDKSSLVNAINEVDAGKLDTPVNQPANVVFAGPTSGSAQPPEFRALTFEDLPPTGVSAGTYVKVTVNEEGQVTAGDVEIDDANIAPGAGIAWSKISKSGAQASEIGNTPAGNIAAVTVQSAINELDTEKAAVSHTHLRSAITDLTSQALDTFAAPGDNTSLNATTSAHGLFPKLHGSLERVLNGLGAWVRVLSSIKISGTEYSDISRLTIQGTAVLSHNQITDTDGRQAVVLTLTGSGTGGGATALSALTDDVLIDSPTDGNLLRFNASDGKWKNVPATNVMTPGHTIQNDGSNLTNFPTLNFTDGLTAAVDGSTIKVSGPMIEADGTALARKKVLNVTGSLTASVNGSEIDITGPVIHASGTPLAAKKVFNFISGMRAVENGSNIDINAHSLVFTGSLADGEAQGIIDPGVAAVSLTPGQFVQMNSAGKWALANATTAANCTGKVAICLSTASADGAILVLLIGKIRLDAVFPTFTIGGAVYFSAATAGAATQNQPTDTGNIVRVAGYADAEKVLYFNPSVPIELK